MKEQAIRTLKMNITQKFTLEERRKIREACKEAKEAYKYFEEKSLEIGECLGSRIYREKKEEIEKKFKLVPKSALQQIALQVARRLYAPRAMKREIKEEMPLNRNIFKAFNDSELCLITLGDGYRMLIDLPIPKHFTWKYTFNKTNYRWGRLEVANWQIFITITYDIVAKNERGPQLTFNFAHC